ncbi:hypothetical protein [Streptomyces uncialis]|uniref:hypothetical protein n=1 Tax=Streptomyces uncialis TaxID=1048205 RepID=UPI003404861C
MTALPLPDVRLALLRSRLVEYPGPWTTAEVVHLYRRHYDERANLRSVARHDLRRLHREGLLVEVDAPDHHHYVLNTR